MADNYEDLLKNAFEKIKPTTFCDRFEIKQVEGYVEGNKTIINNFTQIASCIRRDKDHFSRFLFKELASQGGIEGDRLILTRKVPSKMINEKVEKYVETFVRCKKCGKPDTELVKDETKVLLRCMACGEKKEIHNI
jgi:translation initiation factor 2 subunit 2